ncbi:hypothetical protein SCHPADRAFT_721823 [Schizopora paradoxa]|uniref:Uncharacterized protein n=1 Tax=Schizopora paradoxa TaxID=27342 RepID=A0A0H2R1E8_9AGAM|nr:hypothetical protein SCHPADRAFT_721823 [Schizopora paradoxa]
MHSRPSLVSVFNREQMVERDERASQRGCVRSASSSPLHRISLGEDGMESVLSARHERRCVWRDLIQAPRRLFVLKPSLCSSSITPTHLHLDRIGAGYLRIDVASRWRILSLLNARSLGQDFLGPNSYYTSTFSSLVRSRLKMYDEVLPSTARRCE